MQGQVEYRSSVKDFIKVLKLNTTFYDQVKRSSDSACSEWVSGWVGEAGDATIAVLSWEWSVVMSSMLDSVISSTYADHKILKSMNFIQEFVSVINKNSKANQLIHIGQKFLPNTEKSLFICIVCGILLKRALTPHCYIITYTAFESTAKIGCVLLYVCWKMHMMHEINFKRVVRLSIIHYYFKNFRAVQCIAEISWFELTTCKFFAKECCFFF
jgi:hypothetical protein